MRFDILQQKNTNSKISLSVKRQLTGLHPEISSALPTDSSHCNCMYDVKTLDFLYDVCNKEFSVNYSSSAKSIVGILCVCKAMLDAINDNDFLWRPVVRVQLQRQAGMRVSFMFLHVRHCFML